MSQSQENMNEGRKEGQTQIHWTLPATAGSPIKTPERCHTHSPGVFIVNFEHITFSF